jgi:hypothetical protein
MGSSVFPAPSAASKTRKVETLTSGTSWTVPTGVTYVNVKLFGGGAGSEATAGQNGYGGQVIESTVTTTPAAAIVYAIGAGGGLATVGGNTTFTGATTASGGVRGVGYVTATRGEGAGNGAGGVGGQGATGGDGKIEIEYWV